MAESGGTERSGGADRADHKGSAAEARGSVSAERAGEIAEKIASGKGAAERASVETAAQDAAPGPSPEQAAAEAEKQRQEAEAARASYGEPVASSAPAPPGPAAGPTASATAAAAAPRSWGQTLAEQAAVTLGGAIGAASAVTGWAADMIGGVAAAAKTGWQAGTVGLEAATGLVPDSYAARQRADLEARVDAFKAAAQEILRDPAAVAAAVAENYAVRFEAADALEAAYRSGRADLSVLTEAASMRAEARTELGILGVETAATAVAGVGALAKGLRAAHIADHLTDAAPLAMAMAGTERARASQPRWPAPCPMPCLGARPPQRPRSRPGSAPSCCAAPLASPPVAACQLRATGCVRRSARASAPRSPTGSPQSWPGANSATSGPSGKPSGKRSRRTRRWRRSSTRPVGAICSGALPHKPRRRLRSAGERSSNWTTSSL